MLSLISSNSLVSVILVLLNLLIFGVFLYQCYSHYKFYFKYYKNGEELFLRKFLLQFLLLVICLTAIWYLYFAYGKLFRAEENEIANCTLIGLGIIMPGYIVYRCNSFYLKAKETVAYASSTECSECGKLAAMKAISNEVVDKSRLIR